MTFDRRIPSSGWRFRNSGSGGLLLKRSGLWSLISPNIHGMGRTLTALSASICYLERALEYRLRSEVSCRSSWRVGALTGGPPCGVLRFQSRHRSGCTAPCGYRVSRHPAIPRSRSETVADDAHGRRTERGSREWRTSYRGQTAQHANRWIGPGEDCLSDWWSWSSDLPGVDGILGAASFHAKRIDFDFTHMVLRCQ